MNKILCEDPHQVVECLRCDGRFYGQITRTKFVFFVIMMIYKILYFSCQKSLISVPVTNARE